MSNFVEFCVPFGVLFFGEQGLAAKGELRAQFGEGGDGVVDHLDSGDERLDSGRQDEGLDVGRQVCVCVTDFDEPLAEEERARGNEPVEECGAFVF